MNRFNSLGVFAVFVLAAAVASAQQLTAEQAQNAAETRQAVFKLLAWNMDPMGDMLRNRREFDPNLVARSADRIAQLAVMIPDAFEPDTRGAQVTTQARDAIWGNADDFGQKADDLASAAAELAVVAETGDRGTVARAIGALGQACGNCHDAYRNQ